MFLRARWLASGCFQQQTTINSLFSAANDLGLRDPFRNNSSQLAKKQFLITVFSYWQISLKSFKNLNVIFSPLRYFPIKANWNLRICEADVPWPLTVPVKLFQERFNCCYNIEGNVNLIAVDSILENPFVWSKRSLFDGLNLLVSVITTKFSRLIRLKTSQVTQIKNLKNKQKKLLSMSSGYSDNTNVWSGSNYCENLQKQMPPSKQIFLKSVDSWFYLCLAPLVVIIIPKKVSLGNIKNNNNCNDDSWRVTYQLHQW